MSFVATIQADIDNFQSNLDKAQAKMDQFSDGIGKKIANIGKNFQIIGGALSIGVTAPMVAAGTAAFNMAAEFEDALGATDQIFKDSANGVKDWADNLETYFGISKQEALEYSNLMGSMLVNIGKLTEDQAAKQGAKLIELAGDLTAMYGGQTQDAVRALTGALKGNNTMLDNYGMAVNDALVKARAFELGLIKQGEEMSLAAKQSATLSLIFEQTAAAQGQAAREADGASGSIRALKTEISNISTELGMVLLPIITPLISKLRDLVAGFRSIQPETQRLIVVVSAVAAAIGPFLLALGSILKMAPLVGTAFSVMTGPIGITVAAIAAAVAVIIRNWDTIRDYFTSGNGAELWSRIAEGAQNLWQKLTSLFNELRTFMKLVWDRIGSNVMSIVGNTFNTVGTIIDTVIRNIIEVINVFSALLRGDFTGALSAFGRMWGNIWNGLKRITVNVLANVSQAISSFLKLVGADELGSSLEKWANGLTKVKGENDQLASSMNAVMDVPLPKKLKETTETTSGLTKEVDKAKKATRNYREELIAALADMGDYDSMLANISNKFSRLREIAKKAGASTREFGIIAREEMGEKLMVSLDAVANKLNSTFREARKTLNEGLKLNFDRSALQQQITIPVELNPVLRHGVYERVTSTLLKETQRMTDQLNATFAQGIGRTVSSIAQSIGESLTTGGNFIEAIGTGLLRGLGDLAQSIGEQMIAFGTAGIALKMLMANPFLAIAAGAALVALGSMASSSIGNQVSNYSGGSVGNGYRQSVDSTNQAFPRGAYFNNDRQVVELKLQNTELRGAFNLDNRRNNRLG